MFVSIVVLLLLFFFVNDGYRYAAVVKFTSSSYLNISKKTNKTTTKKTYIYTHTLTEGVKYCLRKYRQYLMRSIPNPREFIKRSRIYLCVLICFSFYS